MDLLVVLDDSVPVVHAEPLEVDDQELWQAVQEVLLDCWDCHRGALRLVLYNTHTYIYTHIHTHVNTHNH